MKESGDLGEVSSPRESYEADSRQTSEKPRKDYDVKSFEERNSEEYLRRMSLDEILDIGTGDITLF